MFRLIKMAIYALVGYAIYQFVRGMLEGESAAPAARIGELSQAGSRRLNRGRGNDRGRTNMTGAARGERVMTEDASGESVPHTVGRGVIR